MIRNAEALVVGDRQAMDGIEWVIEAVEMQDGRMQVLWRGAAEERRWDEYEPGVPVVVSPARGAEWVRSIKKAGDLLPGDRRVGTQHPPFTVAGVDAAGPVVVVEWTNGAAIRVREYEPHVGILVETPAQECGRA
ncbi:MAG TPA: hypothetical protein VLK84_11745 [Longimicrobium sp.]|nr:hypothetical protein [Longimicrobium sp.]